MVLGGIPPGRVGRRRNNREKSAPHPRCGAVSRPVCRGHAAARVRLRYDRLSCHLPAVPFGAARRLAPVGREMVADRQRRGRAQRPSGQGGVARAAPTAGRGRCEATTRTDPTAPGVRRLTDPVSATVRDARRRRAGRCARSRQAGGPRPRWSRPGAAGGRAGRGPNRAAEGRLDSAGPRAAGPARLARPGGGSDPARAARRSLAGRSADRVRSTALADPPPGSPDHRPDRTPSVRRRPPAPDRVDHPQTARPRGRPAPPAPHPADHPQAAPASDRPASARTGSGRPASDRTSSGRAPTARTPSDRATVRRPPPHPDGFPSVHPEPRRARPRPPRPRDGAPRADPRGGRSRANRRPAGVQSPVTARWGSVARRGARSR